MYKKVELTDGFVGMERKVAENWKKKDIVKKNFDMNKGKRYFTFYDGPPTANGKPHVGHIETRVMKDIIPRYKVMKGYQVIRKEFLNLEKNGIKVYMPDLKLCTDNAAMIASAGYYNFIEGKRDGLDLNAIPNLRLD